MFWFFIFVAGIIFFLNCSLAAVSIQVCTAKMNLSDEVDLEDYVCRPDKISAADVSLLSLRGFSMIILNNLHLNYWDTVCIGSLVVCYLKKAPLTCNLLRRLIHFRILSPHTANLNTR